MQKKNKPENSEDLLKNLKAMLSGNGFTSGKNTDSGKTVSHSSRSKGHSENTKGEDAGNDAINAQLMETLARAKERSKQAPEGHATKGKSESPARSKAEATATATMIKPSEGLSKFAGTPEISAKQSGSDNAQKTESKPNTLHGSENQAVNSKEKAPDDSLSISARIRSTVENEISQSKVQPEKSETDSAAAALSQDESKNAVKFSPAIRAKSLTVPEELAAVNDELSDLDTDFGAEDTLAEPYEEGFFGSNQRNESHHTTGASENIIRMPEVSKKSEISENDRSKNAGAIVSAIFAESDPVDSDASMEYITEDDDDDLDISLADIVTGAPSKGDTMGVTDETDKHISEIAPSPKNESDIKKRGFIVNDSDIDNTADIPGLVQQNSAKDHKSAAERSERNGRKKKIISDNDKSEKALNENDIALAIDFGYEYELAKKIGFENVEDKRRKLNNEKNSEDIQNDLRNTYGYCGSEYVSYSQNEDINEKFTRIGKQLKIQTVVTAVLLLIVFAFENASLFTDNHFGIEVFAKHPVLVSAVSFVLLAIATALSAKKLGGGFIDSLKFNASEYSVTAYSVISVLVYDIVSMILVSKGKEQFVMLNTVALFGILIALVSSCLNYKREAATFAVVSAEGKKYIVEKYDPIVKRRKPEPSADERDAGKNEYKAVCVDIPGEYFERTAKCSKWKKRLNFMIPPIFAAALAVFLVSYIKTGDLYKAYSFLVCTVALCMPTYMLLFNAVSFIYASVNMQKRNCAIIGEGSVEDYADADSVVFGERAMIEAKFNNIVRERSCSDYDMEDLIKYIGAILAAFDSSVSDALSEIITPQKCRDEISIVSIDSDGVKASVNSSQYIYIGERDFMVRNGIQVQSASVKVNSEEITMTATKYLYIAVDELMCWKLALDYMVKQEFLDMVAIFADESIAIDVETVNPNINEGLMAEMHIPASVHFIRPDKFGFSKREPIENNGITENSETAGHEVVISSGIVSVKESDIAYPLIWCKRLKNNLRLGLKLVCILSALSAVFLSVLAAFELYALMDSAILLLISFLLNVPSMLAGIFMKPIRSGNDENREINDAIQADDQN